MMVNRYNTARKDAGQLFMEYVLSDEAAIAFAKFGARPIRYVLGQQELPAEATANWLPEETYQDVVVVEDFTADRRQRHCHRLGRRGIWVADSEGIALESGATATPSRTAPGSSTDDRERAGGVAAGPPALAAGHC